MPGALTRKAVYMTEPKMLLNTTESRGDGSTCGINTYTVTHSNEARQGHPRVVTEKESGDLTAVLVSYRKELPCMSESDPRVFSSS